MSREKGAKHSYKKLPSLPSSTSASTVVGGWFAVASRPNSESDGKVPQKGHKESGKRATPKCNAVWGICDHPSSAWRSRAIKLGIFAPLNFGGDAKPALFKAPALVFVKLN